MEKRSGKWGNEENEAWEFFYVRCFACDAGVGEVSEPEWQIDAA